MLVDMNHIENHQNFNPAPVQISLRQHQGNGYASNRIALDVDFMQLDIENAENIDKAMGHDDIRILDAESAISINKFTQTLASVQAKVSSQRCARSIRLALQNAGAVIGRHPVAASDWGSTLTQIGYKQIQPEFNHPQEGDIYIIHRTHKHVYGHIAGFTGSEWVSDFKQKSYDVYKDDGVTYEYYRLGRLF